MTRLRSDATISHVELRDTRNESRTAATQDFSGPKRQETQYNIQQSTYPALPCSPLRSPNNDKNKKHSSPVTSGIVAGHPPAQEPEPTTSHIAVLIRRLSHRNMIYDMPGQRRR